MVILVRRSQIFSIATGVSKLTINFHFKIFLLTINNEGTD